MGIEKAKDLGLNGNNENKFPSTGGSNFIGSTAGATGSARFKKAKQLEDEVVDNLEIAPDNPPETDDKKEEPKKLTGFARLRQQQKEKEKGMTAQNEAPNDNSFEPEKVRSLLTQAVALRSYEEQEYKNISTKANNVKAHVKLQGEELLPSFNTLSLLRSVKVTDTPHLTPKEQQTIGILLSTAVTNGKGNTAQERITNGFDWLAEKMGAWQQSYGETLQNNIDKLLEEIKTAAPNSLAPSEGYAAMKALKEKFNGLLQATTQPRKQKFEITLEEAKTIREELKPFFRKQSEKSIQDNQIYLDPVVAVSLLHNSNPNVRNAVATLVQAAFEDQSFAEDLEEFLDSRLLNDMALKSKIEELLHKASTPAVGANAAVDVNNNLIAALTEAFIPLSKVDITSYLEQQNSETQKALPNAMFAVSQMNNEDKSRFLEDWDTLVSKTTLHITNEVTPAATPSSIKTLVYNYTLGWVLGAFSKAYTAMVNGFKVWKRLPKQKVIKSGNDKSVVSRSENKVNLEEMMTSLQKLDPRINEVIQQTDDNNPVSLLKGTNTSSKNKKTLNRPGSI